MRISLLVGATNYPLAGEDGVSEQEHSSAGGVVIEALAEAQELQYLRASRAAFVDRGKRLTTISFSTTRLFATPAEAELYCLDYDGSIPRAGILVLDQPGAPSPTHLQDALLDPPQRRTIGCTAFLDYLATGSGLVVP